MALAANWKQSPRAWRIFRFIKRSPTPHRIQGETLDGEEVTVSISGTGSQQWTDVMSALGDCWTVKALDKDGAVMRVLEMDPSDPEFASESPERNNGASTNAIISVDVPKLVDNIARNMREVAAGAATQQANAFREGFQAMTSVVNLCLQMLVRVEQRLAIEQERSTDHQLTGDENRNQLAMMALQKVLGGGFAQPAPAPSNGGNGAGVTITPAMINQLLEQFMTPPHGAEGDGSNGVG